jgi:predicted nucleotidyltransferase
LHSTINEQLQQIEHEENVCILHAIESGSRAWGFASPDSDYDVRFIYVRSVSDYLKLEASRDVIEWRQDETLDINGWDISKALKLLHNSNPTLFEWNNSPIVYKTTDYWSSISEELSSFFLLKSGVYHYLSTAKSNYREHLKGEHVKLKKYFYVIRPILAATWILDEKCPPPMLFSELVDAKLDNSIKPAVEDLLEIKISAPEITTGPRLDELNVYIEKSIVQLEEEAKRLPREEKREWDRLNELFHMALDIHQ